MTTPDLQFWDALPREARNELPGNACVLLAAIEGMRRQRGVETFEATDEQLARACGRSVYFVARALPHLRGRWVTWERDHGRRMLTVAYRLKSLDEPKQADDFSAHARRPISACAKTSKRMRGDVFAHALMLPFTEERAGNAELSESEEERPVRGPDSTPAHPVAQDGTGRDDFASLSEGGPEPPPAMSISEIEAELAEAEAEIARAEASRRPVPVMARFRRTVLRRELEDLRNPAPPPRPATTPTPTPLPSPAPMRPGPPRAAPPPPKLIDDAIAFLALGEPGRRRFAVALGEALGEPDNPRTFETLFDAATLLRPDWLAGRVRYALRPGIRVPGNYLVQTLAKDLRVKRQAPNGGRP